MDPRDQFPARFGPFILLRELGAGGMGSAYLAIHTETDTLLVVKRMHPELVRDETIFKRFVHEAEVAAHVRHPNVAALIAMGTIDGEPFLATEFVFGIQVSQIIDRVENSVVDPIPMPVALTLGLELLAGVHAIHEACHHDTGAPLGLIHRDVGARNVLVGFDGKIRLIDLGLGKSILSDWQTAHQVLAGSPDYMPPEQAMGARVDKRADIYGAAVTVWEMIAGKKRIREDSVAARLTSAVAAQPEPLLPHRPDATKRLEAILKQGMATDPDRRTPTAELLAKPLAEELRNYDRKATRQDVVSWLDTACATVIAKERRLLDDAKNAAKNLGQPRRSPNTQMFVEAKHGPLSTPDAYQFYQQKEAADPATRPEHDDRFGSHETFGALAALVDPHNFARAPLWVKIAGAIGFFVFVALITTVTVAVMTPDTGSVTAQTLRPADPPPPPAPPPPIEIPLVAPPPVEPPPARPPPVAPPPRAAPPTTTNTRLSSAVRARKASIVARIRKLRRQKFDIVWQKRLTKLSSRASKARSERALAEVDRALRKMERE